MPLTLLTPGTVIGGASAVSGIMYPNGQSLYSLLNPIGQRMSQQSVLDRFALAVPNNGSTAPIGLGGSWATVGQTTPTLGNTNLHTQMNRHLYSTTAVIDNASGLTLNRAIFWRGNAAGRGGLFFAARVGIETFLSGMQIIVGVSAATTILATEPSARANTIAFGKDEADANWNLIFTNATTPTKVDTLVPVAASSTGGVFDVVFYAEPNASVVYALVVDVSTGTPLTLANNSMHSLTLPVSTTFLIPIVCVRTKAASIAALTNAFTYCRSDL